MHDCQQTNITGRICSTPTRGIALDGRVYCTFQVTYSWFYTVRSEPRRRSCYADCIAYAGYAERLAVQPVGISITLEGHLDRRDSIDGNGITCRRTEVVIDRFSIFLTPSQIQAPTGRTEPQVRGQGRLVGIPTTFPASV